MTSTVISGILLAAGTSSRFGSRNKLLAEIDGEPIVCRAATTLTESELDAVTVVVGHEADRVRQTLRDRLSDSPQKIPVAIVENPRYCDGQASSVRVGIEAIHASGPGGRETDPDAVVFALGDMPFVDSRSVDALLSAYRNGVGDALAAAYNGERGNPVLFDSRHFDDLASVEGDVGGRVILKREGTLVETDDPGVRQDVDTPEDV